MNYIFISALVLILAVSVVVKRTTDKPTDVPSPTPTPSEYQTESPAPTGTSTPASTPTLKPTATPTPSTTAKPDATSNWIYPGSTVIESGDKLVLNSSDSTDKITDWYKLKIESMGFNVKSFVKTSANDVVKNVLKAAKSGDEISVEITKNPGDSEARIEVVD